MKEYLDYIFLENLVVNYFIFEQINKMTKLKVKIYLKIIISIVLSIYVTFAYVYSNSFFSNLSIKILIVNICIYILYRPQNTITYLKEILLYFFINFMYVGIIIVITVFLKIKIDNFLPKMTVYIISYFLLDFFNLNMWKLWKKNIKKDSLTYKVNIRGKEFLGFVDTGNEAKSFVNRADIFFINSKFFLDIINTSDITKKIHLNVRTIQSKSDLDGYLIKNIKIYKNENNVKNIPKAILCFVDSGIFKDYDVLLNSNAYFEYLEGD